MALSYWTISFCQDGFKVNFCSGFVNMCVFISYSCALDGLTALQESKHTQKQTMIIFCCFTRGKSLSTLMSFFSLSLSLPNRSVCSLLMCKNSTSCVTEKKKKKNLREAFGHILSGADTPPKWSKTKWVTPVRAIHTWLKNTQGAVGLDKLEVLAANNHLTTNAPADSEAPELSASSKIKD